MVWIRNDKIDKSKIDGKKIIVGHTPKPLNYIEQNLEDDKIMLDGGCVYLGRYPGMGYLCAYKINTKSFNHVKNMDF